jgi:hypothetical protein
LSDVVIETLSDYYRIPQRSLACTATAPDGSSGDVGFFEFGAKNICYGRCLSGVSVDMAGSAQWDALRAVRRRGSTIQFPFNLTEVVENLRLEHYRREIISGIPSLAECEPVRELYYLLRDNLPVSVRHWLQRAYFRGWQDLPFPAWPVDFTVDTLHMEFLRLLMETSSVKKVPFIWFWPDGAPNCLIMTHDVETAAGRNFTSKLMDMDDSYGFKASFQVIPEKRYEVPDEYVREIRSRGREFNIHDLTHDGRLYQERAQFLRRAAEINAYIRMYDAQGFRAGAMYRNQDWYDAFEFSYDMSVPNVAHLEPMRGGCCTVMPYFIGKILELPLTTAEDYSLFHILNDYSIDLWKQQSALLRERNGLMSFIAHPDYLIEQRARYVYESLLDYLRQMVDREKIWTPLPGEVDHWWRVRSHMKLVQKGNSWEIEGPEAERARIAFAIVDGDRLIYDVTGVRDYAGVVH